MEFPNSSGLLLSVVDGFIEEEEIMINCIDNYHYPFHDFVGKAQTSDLVSMDIENCIQTPRLYIISGHKDKVSCVEQVWRRRLERVFNQLSQNKYEQILKNINDNLKKTDYYCLESFYWLYLSELITSDTIHYPEVRGLGRKDSGIVILIFYWTSSPSDQKLNLVEQTIDFWIDRERPYLKGFQCLTRSFILRNMIGRKVLAFFPDRYGDWGVLLEGGIYLPLTEGFENRLRKLNSEHIGQWTIGEVEEILLNPIYSFGYYYQYIDLVCEWFYVFLYALATTDEEELSNVNLELLYRHFCEYLGQNICPYTVIEEKIIEVSRFIEVFKITLKRIRDDLKGEEETGISKNILLMMRNRHAYLPEVHGLIRKFSNLTMNNNSGSYELDYNYWGSALSQLEHASDSFEKGVRFEELAQYFIRTVPGLKITDLRAKRGRAEIDIFCCNISNDSLLWKLGALILIECKNRKNKVAVSDIRNMVPTMEAKGIHGAMVFSRAGFTSVALEEIKYQLSGGKLIIPISLKEINEICENKDSYNLVRGKIEHFERILEDDMDQMYF